MHKFMKVYKTRGGAGSVLVLAFSICVLVLLAYKRNSREIRYLKGYLIR